MATPLENLQAAYASVCQQIAAALADPKPSYSEKGRSISWNEYYAGLTAREAELRKIPGVAPSTQPVFEVVSGAR